MGMELEYGRAEVRRRGVFGRVAMWLGGVACIGSVLWVGGSLVPCSRVTQVDSCAICGTERETKRSYICGIQTKQGQVVYATDFTERYDKFVAEPHSHDWMRTAHSRSSGGLWGYSGVGCGGSTPPRVEVMEMAVSWIDEFERRPIEVRRLVYRRLVECKSPEEVVPMVKLLRDWAPPRPMPEPE